jgi:hypothetical protein
MTDTPMAMDGPVIGAARQVACGDGRVPSPRAYRLPIRACATRLTAFDEMANPTPSLAPELLAICEFMPITSPAVSSSGPPELP